MTLSSQLNEIKSLTDKYKKSRDLTIKGNLTVVYKHIKISCEEVYKNYEQELKKSSKQKLKLDIIYRDAVDFLREFDK